MATKYEHIDTYITVLEDPGKVIRSLVKEKNAEVATMKLPLNEIRRHSYKRRKGQLLTARAQDDHLKKARKLLNKLKRSQEPGTLGFFSEEKNFCQDQLQNAQNSKWLAFSPPEVPRITKTRFFSDCDGLHLHVQQGRHHASPHR